MRPTHTPMGTTTPFARFAGDAGRQPFGNHPNTAGSPGSAPASHNMPARQYSSPASHQGKLKALAVFSVRGY